MNEEIIIEKTIWDDERFTLTEIEEAKKEYKDIKDDWQLPSTDPDQWKGLKDDAYKPDKSEYIMNMFKKSFPDIKIENFDELTKILSRHKALKTWYSSVNLNYVDTIQMPTYFKDLMTPDKYKESISKLGKLNDALVTNAKAKKKLAEDYKKLVEAEDSKLNKIKEEVLENDKWLFIINLPSDLLPINITKAIASYTPKLSSSPTQKMYAREALINYKIYLAKLLKKQPSIDIIKFVKSRLF